MAGEEVEAQSLHKECLCLLELLLMKSSPLHKQMPEKVETLTSMSHKEKNKKQKTKEEFTTYSEGSMKIGYLSPSNMCDYSHTSRACATTPHKRLPPINSQLNTKKTTKKTLKSPK